MRTSLGVPALEGREIRLGHTCESIGVSIESPYYRMGNAVEQRSGGGHRVSSAVGRGGRGSRVQAGCGVARKRNA